MTNDLTPFRTVRELLVNSDCVLMGNAVNTEGKLYDDSVENLTAILAMQDSYREMLSALETALPWLTKADIDGAFDGCALPLGGRKAWEQVERAIVKAKGN